MIVDPARNIGHCRVERLNDPADHIISQQASLLGGILR